MVAQKHAARGLFASGDSALLAELRSDLSTLAAKYEEPIQRSSDELGSYDFIIMRLGKSKVALLYQYRDMPDMGTMIRIDSQADKAKLWFKIWRMLDLSEDAIIWVDPEALAS